MTRPMRSPREARPKALRPIYIGVVSGHPDGALWSYSRMTAKRWRYAGWKCDSVVKYIPAPTRRARKGGTRGK